MSLEAVFLKREIRELEDETFELYSMVDNLEEEVVRLQQVIQVAEVQKPDATKVMSPERVYWGSEDADIANVTTVVVADSVVFSEAYTLISGGFSPSTVYIN